MAHNQNPNIIDLASELATAETSAAEIIMSEAEAKKQEQAYLNKNFKILKDEIATMEEKMPFPDVKEYDVGIDFSDISDIQYKKRVNKPYRDKINGLDLYCKTDPLYVGHLQTMGEKDYYFMDSNLNTLALNDRTVLVAVMDKNFDEYRRMWRFPKKKVGITFSRNVSITNKQVIKVDSIFDASSEIISGISDNYLRKALIQNKTKNNIVSIIQTIQEKQDQIMSDEIGKSFIVQGCAGSGKTVVMLNRLRYLIFNNLLTDRYSVLTPSNQFVKFISSAAIEYNVNIKAIYSYKQYYDYLYSQYLASSSEKIVFSDESVYPQNFLNRIYSEDFIRACYASFAKKLFEITNEFVDYCENKLNYLISKEEQGLKQENERIINDYRQEILYISNSLQNFDQNIDDKDINPQTILQNCKQLLDKAVEKYNTEKAKISAMNISIPAQEVESFDSEIIDIKKDMQIANEKIQKANFFTRPLWKRRYDFAKEVYDKKYHEAEKLLIEQKRESLLKNNTTDFENNLKIDTLRKTLANLEKIIDRYEKALAENNGRLNDLQSYVEQKYHEEGDAFKAFFEAIEVNMPQIEKASKELLACSVPLSELCKTGKNLYKVFKKFDDEKIKNKEKKEESKFNLFNDKYTDSELYNNLRSILMRECRSIIKAEFKINLGSSYKYYSYLSLYFAYLIQGPVKIPSKYLFIDEAQDLSLSEMRLLNKINRFPVINLFGDTYQVITEYGITNWSKIEWLKNIYYLEENFRNTNQVIDFCNACLPSEMQMEKIGIDMDSVKTFNTLDDILRTNIDWAQYSVIVKDEIAKRDLLIEFSNNALSPKEFYTVKEAKGLEFYRVIVLDRDMTINEKYISYTRSLNELIVVKNFPHYSSSEDITIVQDED